MFNRHSENSSDIVTQGTPEQIHLATIQRDFADIFRSYQRSTLKMRRKRLPPPAGNFVYGEPMLLRGLSLEEKLAVTLNDRKIYKLAMDKAALEIGEFDLTTGAVDEVDWTDEKSGQDVRTSYQRFTRDLAFATDVYFEEGEPYKIIHRFMANRDYLERYEKENNIDHQLTYL